MTSSGNNFNDFPELVPTREITTKMEKTFLFLVNGRGPISWMGIKAAASIAPTLIRHWAKLGMFVVGEFWAHVYAILHCSLRTQFRELEFSSVHFSSVHVLWISLKTTHCQCWRRLLQYSTLSFWSFIKLSPCMHENINDNDIMHIYI